MEELTYIKATSGQEGTSGVMSHVTLRRNDVIELLKSLEGLKKQLQPLLKQEGIYMINFAYNMVKEIKEVHTPEEANYLLQNGWVLLLVSNTYTLGRLDRK